VTVVVDSDRVQAGRTAIRTEGADTLILDDGFQHRRLARDLELLVMDASNPWGNGRLLPAGPLREGLPALKRAHAVLLTRVNESEQTEDVIQTLRHYTQVPVLTSVHRPCGWVDLSGRTYPVSHLQRKRAFAFCGIGNPGSFYKTLQELGVNITAFEIFPDHFWYAQRDRDRLWARAKASGAEALVMTEKDSVRMGPGPVDELPAYALQIELAMGKDEERMRKLLQDVLGS
jgi:tetraacyldisaccharide 4'-kinase